MATQSLVASYGSGGGQPAGMYSNGTTYYTGGGHSSSTTTSTEVIVGIGPQTFRVTCTGLKPSTIHYAYLLSTNVSVNCAPLNNYVFGANLVTDSTGYLQFDYAFKPTNAPFPTDTDQTGQIISIIPAGNQALKVSSSDEKSYAQSYMISKGTVSS